MFEPKRYFWLVIGDGPTVIIVNSMIRSISKIDDYKMVSRDAVAGPEPCFLSNILNFVFLRRDDNLTLLRVLEA